MGEEHSSWGEIDPLADHRETYIHLLIGSKNFPPCGQKAPGFGIDGWSLVCLAEGPCLDQKLAGLELKPMKRADGVHRD